MTQLTDVAPDVQQGRLRRVLGTPTVAEDAVGDAEQGCVVGDGQRCEGVLIAMLYPTHEVLVHAPTPLRNGRSGR